MSTFTTLPAPLLAVLLLVASNVFMTFAWYGHLKNLSVALCMLGAVYFVFRSA